MTDEFGRKPSMSEQTSLEPDLTKKAPGEPGSLSDTTPLENMKSEEEIDKLIAGYKKLINEMTQPGANVNMEELEEAREKLRELLGKKRSLDDTVKY